MKKYFFLLFFALITQISFSQNNELISNNKLYFWLGSRKISNFISSENRYFSNSELELSANYNNWGISYYKVDSYISNGFSNSWYSDCNMFFGFYRYNLGNLFLVPRIGVGNTLISQTSFLVSNNENVNRTCVGTGIEIQYGMLNWLSIVGGFNVYSIKDYSLKGITFGLQIGRIRDKKK